MSEKIIDCEEALRRLADYLDAELSGEHRREVDHHLQRCRSCFSRAEFEKRLKTRLAEIGHKPVGDEFEQRIRSLITQFTCP